MTKSSSKNLCTTVTRRLDNGDQILKTSFRQVLQPSTVTSEFEWLTGVRKPDSEILPANCTDNFDDKCVGLPIPAVVTE